MKYLILFYAALCSNACVLMAEDANLTKENLARLQMVMKSVEAKVVEQRINAFNWPDELDIYVPEFAELKIIVSNHPALLYDVMSKESNSPLRQRILACSASILSEEQYLEYLEHLSTEFEKGMIDQNVYIGSLYPMGKNAHILADNYKEERIQNILSQAVKILPSSPTKDGLEMIRTGKYKGTRNR